MKLDKLARMARCRALLAEAWNEMSTVSDNEDLEFKGYICDIRLTIADTVKAALCVEELLRRS